MAAGVMYELNNKGDSRITWDPDVSAEVKAARKHFERMTKRGYSAFRSSSSGGRGARVSEFDPEAAEIVLVPAMAGGR